MRTILLLVFAPTSLLAPAHLLTEIKGTDISLYTPLRLLLLTIAFTCILSLFGTLLIVSNMLINNSFLYKIGIAALVYAPLAGFIIVSEGFNANGFIIDISLNFYYIILFLVVGTIIDLWFSHKKRIQSES